MRVFPRPSRAAGKYLNAIRQCGQEVACPFEAPIAFGVDERAYGPSVQRCYRFATSALLDHLMAAGRLLERMVCLKNYFLLQQADFLVHFLDVAGEELQVRFMQYHDRVGGVCV